VERIRNSTAKLVSKPWGEEKWLADGRDTPYALKRITFLSGMRSSLQVHEFKFETNYVLSGTGIFLLSENPIDVRSYLASEERAKIEEKIYSDLREIELIPETVIDVPPGYVHRVIAKTDLVFVECSSTELDDVIRISDDSGRGNGRIDSEHHN
jgi:mannose-6-phosphate isomerase